MSRTVITPLRYPGGKTQLYEYVKSLIGENNSKSYIEPYMGGAGVAFKLLINGDVDKLFLNDFDKSIYAFWYSVLNHTDDLIKKINETEVTVQEWKKQKLIQESKDETNDLLELGFSTFFLNRTNRSGILKAGIIGGKSQAGIYKIDCRFNKPELIKRIELISKYRNKINLYNMDAIDFIKKIITRTKDSFTFFDPPYYNKGPILYTNFYKHSDHEELANIINKHMKNQIWILTYDVEPEIRKLYVDKKHVKYYLRYSISDKNKGIEYMFYSPKIINNYSNKILRLFKEGEYNV